MYVNIVSAKCFSALVSCDFISTCENFMHPSANVEYTHSAPLKKNASINNGIPNKMTGESTVLFGLSISIFTGLTLDHVIVLTTDRTSQINIRIYFI